MPSRRHRVLRAARLACLPIALALAVTAPPAQAAEVGAVSDLTWGGGQTVTDRTMPLLRETGVRWVRLNVSWAAVEPNGKGILDAGYLGQVDYAVDAARANGIRVLMPIADGVPYWASGDPAKSSVTGVRTWTRLWRPTRFSDYGDAVAAVVRRYSARGVHHFEVWNEPNHAHFWPSGPNAAEYVEMLKAGAAAIRREDAAATVLLGGIAGNDYGWLERVYAAGGRGQFDAASVHPYTGAVDPTWCWDQAGTTRKAKDAFCGLEEMRASMVAAGDADKPLWITEFGWSSNTGDYGVSEQTQADYLTKAYEKLESYPWVPVALWYSFRNNPGLADAAAPWEANTGLVRTDYVAKPALSAMRGYALASGPAPAPEPTPTPSPAPEPTPTPTPGPAPGDERPAVTLTAPAAGAQFGDTLAYRAQAGDDRGIARVEFLLDGEVVATDTAAPYERSWKVPRRIALGAHVAGVRAVDTAGQASTSEVTVKRVSTRKLAAATRRTATSLRVTPRPGRAIVVRGRVHGARGGRLVVSVRRPGARRAGATRTVRLRPDGWFRSRLRVRGARGGRVRVVARFSGSRRAMPSGKASLVRLA